MIDSTEIKCNKIGLNRNVTQPSCSMSSAIELINKYDKLSNNGGTPFSYSLKPFSDHKDYLDAVQDCIDADKTVSEELDTMVKKELFKEMFQSRMLVRWIDSDSKYGGEKYVQNIRKNAWRHQYMLRNMTRSKVTFKDIEPFTGKSTRLISLYK